MVRKKVDERLRILLSNCVKTNHRSLVVIVGDNGKDQVVNIHYILSKLQVKARPSVLWCYKKELGFSSYKKKRMKHIKKMVQRGLYDPEKDDPFELFVSSTSIRWTFYKDSEKILGQTFGMCVLQDFEALTPNLLARTIETVEGGGTIVVLLKKLDSLKQFYSLAMDIHSRFRTEAHSMVKPRFNERWLLSLSTCTTCVVVDDELNILPISKHIRDLQPLENDGDDNEENGTDSWNLTKVQEKKLADLKESLSGTQPAASLVGLAKTVDQAKAILTFLDVVADKSLASTVTLTAGRGRGKSAALGIAIASAIAFGYSNIFVTSPSPENLKTVFEFVFKAFDALEYKEHLDYEMVQSTNPDYNKAIVRVSVFHQHRQTIQYIEPQDHEKLAQAELVVIDEAAAIPLPLVRNLIGPYLVFLSSTINGYEGTGRSLSLKLINQLRNSSARAKSATEGGWRTNEFMYKKSVRKQMAADAESGKAPSEAVSTPSDITSRSLRELVLDEPIRYSSNDPVEAWLNKTLCLDATDVKQVLTRGTPHPSATQLFAVDRDVLFSHHSLSEAMLQRIVSLFVASHYKNSPNDLMLLSDAPAHRLFVLVGPQSDDAESAEDALPDILCAVQVSLEGGIAKSIVQDQLRQGNRASGDLVPWTISQQFQDNDFGQLDGARVVRIATNPGATRMGYGKRALELLSRFYQGELMNPDTIGDEETFENLGAPTKISSKGLQGEKVKPRKNLPPLMVPLSDLRPPRLHYMSVSYGMTKDLFNFWATSGYRPVYLRQTANDLTGEYTCIMLHPLDTADLTDGLNAGWEENFCKDFTRRFLSLLPGPFREISSTLALSIVNSTQNKGGAEITDDDIDAGNEKELVSDATKLELTEMNILFLPHDLKRLQAYSRNLVDFHMVTDLLSRICHLFFEKRLPGAMSLSLLQRALLVGMGLQNKTVEVLSAEYDMGSSQLLALFNKSIRKITSTLNEIQEEAAQKEVDLTPSMAAAKKAQDSMRSGKTDFNAITTPMEYEQEVAGVKEMQKLKKAQEEMLESLDLDDFAVGGSEEQWSKATSKTIENGGIVTVAKSNNKSKSRATTPKDRKRDKEDDRSGQRSGKKHRKA